LGTEKDVYVYDEEILEWSSYFEQVFYEEPLVICAVLSKESEGHSPFWIDQVTHWICILLHYKIIIIIMIIRIVSTYCSESNCIGI